MVDLTPKVHREGSYWGKSVSSSDGRARFDGEPPGTYEVTVGAWRLPGWTSSTETVELRAGETTTVVLKLEPKP